MIGIKWRFRRLLKCRGDAGGRGGLLGLSAPRSRPFEIGWCLVLCGIGFGFFQTPNMKAIMSSAPANRSGGASGILAASRLFGQSVGAAIVAICLSFSPENGIWAAIWAGAVLGVLGSIVSFLRLLPMVETRASRALLAARRTASAICTATSLQVKNLPSGCMY